MHNIYLTGWECVVNMNESSYSESHDNLFTNNVTSSTVEE